MSRKLTVVIPQLTQRHRAEILEAAHTHGFEAAFFEEVSQARAALEDAEIVFGQPAELAKSAPRLRWLCTPSAGVNQFTAPGVFASKEAVLTNSSGAYGVTIAEHIIMVTLEMMRRQQEYAGIVERREWVRSLPIRSIRGSRVALLGTGDIGREAAVRLRAFGTKRVVGVNRSGKNPDGLFDLVVTQEALDTVLPETDLLILSLPGTARTEHMLDAARLALLPDGAFIVNVGRGNAIDSKALEGELRAGRLSAALDVFEREPLPQDDSLWTCPNLLITPHIAGNMTLAYTLDRIVELFLEDFENYCAGKPLERRVDLARGY